MLETEEDAPFPMEGDKSQIVEKQSDLFGMRVVRDIAKGKYRDVVKEEMDWRDSCWMIPELKYDFDKALERKKKFQKRYDKIWLKLHSDKEKE